MNRRLSENIKAYLQQKPQHFSHTEYLLVSEHDSQKTMCKLLHLECTYKSRIAIEKLEIIKLLKLNVWWGNKTNEVFSLIVSWCSGMADECALFLYLLSMLLLCWCVCKSLVCVPACVEYSADSVKRRFSTDNSSARRSPVVFLKHPARTWILYIFPLRAYLCRLKVVHRIQLYSMSSKLFRISVLVSQFN